MGKIPEFSRTVLPDNSLGAAAAPAARAQYDVNAANIADARQSALQIDQMNTQYEIHEAQARNATFVNEAVIQAKKDAVDLKDTMTQQRAGNPNGFAKDFDKQLEKLHMDKIKAAPSQAAREAMKTSLSSLRASEYESSVNWQRQRQVSMFGESMDRTAENLSVLALRAGQKGEPVEALLRDADASTIAGSTFVAPEKLVTMRGKMQKNVLQNYLEGMSETSPGKVKEILKSGKYDTVLNADEIQALDNFADRELNRRDSQANLDFDDAMDNVNKASRLGLMVPDDELAAMVTTAKSLGREKEAQSLQKFSVMQADVASFAVKPMKEQAEILKQSRADIEGGNLELVDKYAAYADVLNTKQKALASDPWSYYAAHDIIRNPEPVDLSDGEALAAEIEKRKVDIATIKKMEGFSLPLLAKDELAQIKETYENGQVDETADLITSLGAVFNNDEMRTIAQQTSKDAPMMAVAMTLEPEAAKAVLEGAKSKGEVTEAKSRLSFNERIGGMVFDTEALEGIHGAVYAAYKKLSNDAGDVAKEIDDDRMDKAIEMVIGKPVEIDPTIMGKPSKIFSYKENGEYVSENRLEDIFGKISNPMLMALNGGLPFASDGNSVEAEEILRHGNFVSAGDGLYLIRIEGLGDLFTSDGRPYVLNARKMDAYVSP